MTGAVAAPHTAALAAARASGGNALDLALAAATTLVVAYPHQCHLGGDLIALVREPGGEVHAVLSAGAAPRGVDVDAIRAGHDRMPGAGPHPVTVPGIAAGWAALAGLGATRPLAGHLHAAADLAERGVPVAPGLARAIVDRADAIAADPGLDALFGGLSEGDHLRQPALAATLRALADEGLGVLYGGRIGERIASFLASLGSAMTPEDIATHEAELTAPLTAEALGATWHVAPPPSQGATLLAMLDPAGLELDRARRANAARDHGLGDPRIGIVDVETLVQARASADAGVLASPRRAGDTVAIAAIDDEGRAVTLIQSLYQHFGAGLLEPETGIVLHNRGGAFSLQDGHPGVLAPGARPPHTLCPAIVVRGDTITAAGCQGGRAQPQILAQIAPDLADPDSDLDAAVARPRWIVGGPDLGRERETVVAEPGAEAPAADATEAGLAFERLTALTGKAGHVQVARFRAGAPSPITAASDPRADGGALVL
jgi:gamma-glutamyltranspeptidase